ncbi:hypothetical protein EIP91_000686 [Steccherinum ochraceum]|uniref:Uncharacterized protein n=1 Tax=Steccherinum ochraceum TaxID=92696 RepID=A0A4V2MWN5_9APHY|nr:hypothetical protein EIP91_000686 [Steccherinum ochraceum]
MPVERSSGQESRKYNVLISQLQSQLHGYAARTSILQSRLTAALDELDAQQSAHARELAAEKREKDRLEVKLSSHTEKLKEVEAERDDLREAVLMLVKKVEESGDLREWPRNSFHELLFLLDPLALPAASSTSADPSIPLAATIISSLRAELHKERTSNARVLDYGEREILRLQAQVARRDAELESCIVHNHDLATLDAAWDDQVKPAGVENGIGKKQISAASLSREEALAVMGLVQTRNRRLEDDVSRLSDRLRKVQVHKSNRPPPKPAERPLSQGAETVQSRSQPVDPVVADLQAQIERLSDAIDLFQEEGQAIREALECAHFRTSEESRHTVAPLVHDLMPNNAPASPTTEASPRPAIAIPDLLTHDPEISGDGEQSMDLGTPLLPTVLLDPLTLQRTHAVENDILSPSTRLPQSTDVVDPVDVPLPPSPSSGPVSDPLSAFPPALSPGVRSPSSEMPPPSKSTPWLVEKMKILQMDLASAQAEVAERDAELVELRRLVDGLRGELSTVRGPSFPSLAEPEAGPSRTTNLFTHEHASGGDVNATGAVPQGDTDMGSWKKMFEEDDEGD